MVIKNLLKTWVCHNTLLSLKLYAVGSFHNGQEVLVPIELLDSKCSQLPDCDVGEGAHKILEPPEVVGMLIFNIPVVEDCTQLQGELHWEW